MGLFDIFGINPAETDDECTDDQADTLSYVGKSAYELLRTKHEDYHHQLWNVTSGRIVNEVDYTPRGQFAMEDDPEECHDDWFPQKICDLISKTEHWCDVMSLGQPDGLFMDKFREALGNLAEKSKDRENHERIVVRMMFGFMGTPINCTVVIRELTRDLPEDANIKLWVGAWRKNASWNHAKIIAVDGRHLYTGGHNLWDPHYLREHPVNDLSFQLEGQVAIDGHRYANSQWGFVKENQQSFFGGIIDKLPDAIPMLIPTRVIISEYPEGEVGKFPPRFHKSKMPQYNLEEEEEEPASPVVPLLSMGRYGAILDDDRPSDDAFVEIFGSAETIIRMALQDLGPVTLPVGNCIALPGMKWPRPYLDVLASVLWLKGVDVEIVLSNPHSIPNRLSPTEANYGNGWSCNDVAAEIIKRIKKQYPDAEDDDLRKKVEENLRVCFLKNGQGAAYADEGATKGLHSKHFIIDDRACYIGSQNLYMCDLAEWGILVDNEDATKKIMDEYWNPMWEASYTGEDCDVEAVMDGLDIDRDGQDIDDDLDDETKELMEQAVAANNGCSRHEEE